LRHLVPLFEAQNAPQGGGGHWLHLGMPSAPHWPPNQCIFKGVPRVLWSSEGQMPPLPPPQERGMGHGGRGHGVGGMGHTMPLSLSMIENALCPPPQQWNTVCEF